MPRRQTRRTILPQHTGEEIAILESVVHSREERRERALRVPRVWVARRRRGPCVQVGHAIRVCDESLRRRGELPVVVPDELIAADCLELVIATLAVEREQLLEVQVLKAPVRLTRIAVERRTD